MPTLNSDRLNDKDYDSDDNLDSLYLFLSENTLLDSKVRGECKLILPYEITTIEIEKKYFFV